MSTGIFQKPLFYDQKDQGTFYQSDLWIQRHKQNQNKKQHAVLFSVFRTNQKKETALYSFFFVFNNKKTRKRFALSF